MVVGSKLILIEGLPGSGKTTATKTLGKHLQKQGVPCRWYAEDDDPHPIDCLDYKLKDLTAKMPDLWRDFVTAEIDKKGVAIIESRLWQNTAMFMVLAEHPISEIRAYHRLVWRELTPLSPCLVFLQHKNVESGLRSVFSSRGEEWIDQALMPLGKYQRFQGQAQIDLLGWVDFFRDWLVVSDRLYQDWPYGKIILKDPHDDWGRTLSTILTAAGLED